MKSLFFSIIMVSWTSLVWAEKSFEYLPQKDTVYLAPQCDCQIPKDAGIKAPPQVKVDTSEVYEGQTPAYEETPEVFHVVVVDTIQSPPPCQCPRVPNKFESDETPQINHVVAGLVAPITYGIIYNRRQYHSAGVGFGAGTLSARLQSLWFNKPFYEDPNYVGVRLGYFSVDTEAEIEDSERELVNIGVQSQNVMVSGVYGWWWQWEFGLKVNAQLALGYPLYSQTDVENTAGVREDIFENEAKEQRNIYRYLSYFQGTGLSIGWVF